MMSKTGTGAFGLGAQDSVHDTRAPGAWSPLPVSTPEPGMRLSVSVPPLMPAVTALPANGG